MARSATVKAKIVVATAFLLLIRKGLEFLDFGSVKVHGSWTVGFTLESSLGWPSEGRGLGLWARGASTRVDLALVDAVVETNSELREILNRFWVLVAKGQSVLDFRLQTGVELGTQSFIVPVQVRAQTEKACRIAGGGGGLGQGLKLTSDGALLVGISKVALELVGEKVETAEE